jgi:hypothetical protein
MAVLVDWLAEVKAEIQRKLLRRTGYCLKITGDPLTRFPLRSTVTSTRSAILIKGMPLFIPYSLRSKAIVPLMLPSQAVLVRWPDKVEDYRVMRTGCSFRIH